MTLRAAAAATAVSAILSVTSLAHAQGAPQQPTQPAPGTQPPPQQPDPWGGMNAGGLTPPAPLPNGQQPPGQPPAGQGGAAPGTQPGAPPTTLSNELDESKEEDSGRGLSWFWIEAQGGYEHVGLQTFEGDDLGAGFVETTANGGVISAGLGAQIIFVTIGARGRMGFFSDWQIGRVGGEVGFKIPVGFVEPRFDIGAGYAALANFDGVVPEEIGIQGFYVRAGAGVDFYPVEVLAIGAVASFDFLGMTRPGLSPAEVAALRASNPAVTDAQAASAAADGSGYGATFAIQANIGLHF